MLPTDAQLILKELMEKDMGHPQATEHILLCGTPEITRRVLLLAALEIKNLTIRPILPSSVSVPPETEDRMLRTCSALSLERMGDIAAILTHLRTGDILFIDALDRLPKTHNAFLSHAMTTFKLHIEAGEGLRVKVVDIELAQFTLVGATSSPGQLKDSLKRCFKQQLTLQDYPDATSIRN